MWKKRCATLSRKHPHIYTCACECTKHGQERKRLSCHTSRPVSVVRPRANCPPDGMSERVVVERMPSDPSLFNSRHHRGDSGHQPDPIVFSLLLRPTIMAGPRGKDLRGKKKVRPCECLRELNCGCAQRVCAAARGHECSAVLMDDIFFHLAGGEMRLCVF